MGLEPGHQPVTPQVPASPRILAPVEACVISIQTLGAFFFFIHEMNFLDTFVKLLICEIL